MFTILLLSWFAQATAPAQTSSVRIIGPKTITLSVQDLAGMKRVTVKATSHGKESTYEGVAMREILTRAGVAPSADLRGDALALAVIVTGADGYRAVYGLAEFDPGFTDRVSILADRQDGAPLSAEEAPFQLILTGEKRAARWVRQVVSIEVRAPERR